MRGVTGNGNGNDSGSYSAMVVCDESGSFLTTRELEKRRHYRFLVLTNKKTTKRGNTSDNNDSGSCSMTVVYDDVVPF